MTEYKVIRSKRRTMAVTVTADGSVTVRAPLGMPDGQIERFVLSKKEWIEKTVASMAVKRNAFRPLGFGEHEAAPFFGRTLNVRENDKITVFRQGDELFVPAADNRKDLVIRFYKSELKKYLLEKIPVYCELLGVSCGSVKVGSAKSRWGSCSASGGLNFSYRLALCPPPVIDYVIVHELSHIRHHDHSPSFWRTVAAVYPQWRQCRQWLRDNSFIMEMI